MQSATYSATANWMPREGDFVVVTMPGEMMRCEVVRLVDRDRIMAKVLDAPVSKVHLFRKDDVIGVRRTMQFGRVIWEALDDRDFLANRSPNEPPKPEVAKRKAAPKKKGKRIA